MRGFTVRFNAVLYVLLGSILFPAAPAMAARWAGTPQGDIYVEIKNEPGRGLHYYIEAGSNQLCEYVLIEHSYEQGSLGLPLNWVKDHYFFQVGQQHGGIFLIDLQWPLENNADNHWFTATCIASDTGPNYPLADVYLYTPWYGQEGFPFDYPFNPPRPWWIWSGASGGISQ